MKLCRNIAWTLSWRFRRKELFYLCLSLAHLLTLCHNEATSRRKGGTRTDTPALQGYHHSPPPFSPLISSAFALWAIAELYILGPSLTYSLSFSLSSFLRQKVGKITQFWCLCSGMLHAKLSQRAKAELKIFQECIQENSERKHL